MSNPKSVDDILMTIDYSLEEAKADLLALILGALPKKKEVNVPKLGNEGVGEENLIISAMNEGYNQALADFERAIKGTLK